MKYVKEKKKTYLLFALACVLLYITQVLFTSLQPSKETIENIPILGFHNIILDEEKETYYKYDIWVDSESAFIEKMHYLYDQGYHTITFDELYAWKQGKLEIDEKAFVLTFDDGYLASKELIPSILEKYNFTATTFVVGTSIQETTPSWDGSSLQYMAQSDLNDQPSMQYASHTYDMHFQKDGKFGYEVLNETQLQEDFDKEKQHVNCDYVAYPYGKYNEQLIQVMQKNNVKLAFGYNENEKASRDGNSYTIPRFAITSYTTMDSFRAMLESR